MPAGASATQFLDIDTVKEDVVVLKDGGLRVILMCSSLNFALKSSDEQDAIIFQYQSFLNSLDFPLQTVIHSRRINIGPYLESLAERSKEEPNELLKIQIGEYMEFIKSFVDMTNIMSKKFFVVVPFTPSIAETSGALQTLTSLFRFGGGASKQLSPDDAFKEYKNQLWQRVNSVLSGLQHVGVRAAPLNTEELVELFYGLYNPSEFEKTSVPTTG